MSIIDKYKDTFDMEGGYSYVYASHDMIAEVGKYILVNRRRSSHYGRECVEVGLQSFCHHSRNFCI